MSLWVAIKDLIVLAIPCAGTKILRYAGSFFTTVYCARNLATKDFAAVSTGLSFSTLTALSIGMGISAALQTLASQAYGRKLQRAAAVKAKGGDVDVEADDGEIGSLLRQSIVVTLLTYFPMAVAHVFLTKPLLDLFQIDSSFVENMALFLQYSAFMIVPMLLSNNCIQFAECQCVPSAGLWASLLSAIVLVPHLLIVRPVTVLSVLMALSINRWFMLAAVVMRIATNPLLAASWSGNLRHSSSSSCSSSSPSMDSSVLSPLLAEMHPRLLWRVFVVGLPTLLANCADTCAFEMLSVTAAAINPVASSAWSVLLSMYGFLFSGASAVASASAVKVGNALGESRPNSARMFAEATLVVIVCVASLLGLFLRFFGGTIFALLDDDMEVSDVGNQIYRCVWWGSLTFFFDLVFYVLQGIFRGAGRQLHSALIVAIGMWCVGVPLARYLVSHEISLVDLWPSNGLWRSLFDITGNCNRLENGTNHSRNVSPWAGNMSSSSSGYLEGSGSLGFLQNSSLAVGAVEEHPATGVMLLNVVVSMAMGTMVAVPLQLGYLFSGCTLRWDQCAEEAQKKIHS